MTISSSRVPSPRRWSISRLVRRVLEEVYRMDQFPAVEMRKQLAQDLGVTQRQVHFWFQNRRQRSRKAQRELIGWSINPTGKRLTPATLSALGMGSVDPSLCPMAGISLNPDVMAMAAAMGQAPQLQNMALTMTQTWLAASGMATPSAGNASLAIAHPDGTAPAGSAALKQVASMAGPPGMPAGVLANLGMVQQADQVMVQPTNAAVLPPSNPAILTPRANPAMAQKLATALNPVMMQHPSTIMVQQDPASYCQAPGASMAPAMLSMGGMKNTQVLPQMLQPTLMPSSTMPTVTLQSNALQTGAMQNCANFTPGYQGMPCMPTATSFISLPMTQQTMPTLCPAGLEPSVDRSLASGRLLGR